MTNFKVVAKDGNARVGVLKTAHGQILTPMFIPVGTQATVKALSPDDLKKIGVTAVLANTYHLMLRPGVAVIKKLGGLHQFMSWDGPIMTDSGGFQVFSLGVGLEHGAGKLLKDEDTPSKPRLNEITEEGVTFQSHLDGSKQLLTPEKSIQLQRDLGADLIVAFDDLESPKHNYEETLKSLELTEGWELRSLKEFKKLGSRQLLYGVTHGGIFKDLRIRSAKFVDKYFEGVALGGAHKDRPTLYRVVEWTVTNVTEGKPRHLLGIGEVEDLFECIERGVDLFDCASPTRRARNGSLYVSPASNIYSNTLEYHTKNFTVSIREARFTQDKRPLDPNCQCYTCQHFSRAYLRHLYISQELLFHRLATIHNLYFITNLVGQIRQAILDHQFSQLKSRWLD